MAQPLEQIFDANAKRMMTEWQLMAFKHDYPKLYNTIIASMQDYGKQKWEQACKETWEAVNIAMGDLPVEDASNLVNVIHPEFKP